MHAQSVATFLFTDIEGSTRLWEQEPERMHEALARHDAIAAACVTGHHGNVVKTTGDGIHAVFADPLDAVQATIAFQLGLARPDATAGIELRVRCGLNLGAEGRRGNDFYGTAVNRAARVMSAAHGGQILVSSTVADAIRDRLPAGVSLHDLGVVRLRDLAHAEPIFQVVHPQLRAQFPALRSLASTPNNLPQSLTSFVGRERELAEVKGRLSTTRLLTLVGIGGLGKSRLSLQAAADVMDDFPDGVWFVELAPVADARLVPQAVASVLGVKEDAAHSVEQALARFVKDRCLLVVLDNCEHLTQACASVARLLLEAGPKVRILASSRERLNLRGETTYPLAPLAAPASGITLAPDLLEQFAAVRLFAERALAVHPDFEITPQNAAAVSDICRQLDGIPLALELAAARTSAMSVDMLAERLSDRFRILRGGDRTALPRQQTLRALIDWSYELLQPDERLLFQRLAVFAGGFTLEAAEVVGAGDDEVLDALTRLVDKSLVQFDAGGQRYRMLETVRQYALERLKSSGEDAAIRTRHLQYCVSLVEMIAPELIGAAQGAWLARLDAERENLLAAHAWCDHAEDGGALGLRLVRAVRFYLFSRGLLEFGYAMIVEALDRDGASQRDILRCRGLSDAGQFALHIGRYDEARGYLEESLAIARELNDASRIAIALQPLGRTYFANGDLGMARRYFSEALELARAQGKPREIAAAMVAMEQLHRVEGDLDAAEAMSTAALALARELDDRLSIGLALLNLAMTALLRGKAPQALAMLREIVAINAELGGTALAQSLLEVASGLAVLRGEPARAAAYYGAADVQAKESGQRRDPADEAFVAAMVDNMRAALGQPAFDDAVEAGRGLEVAVAVGRVAEWLATPE
ncbi:MAG: tetratricopeptide repeat protein [Burkholderiales bacterium]